MKHKTIQADYHNTTHAKDIVALLNTYALDKMGGGKALSSKVQETLVEELAKRPHAFSVLAYDEDKAIGLINCFEAFSTFSAEPLVNLHDVVVSPEYRGQGVNQIMLQKVEDIAIARGCCKLTLEVLEGNGGAQASYAKFGFAGYELDPEMGKAVFWQKGLK